MGLSMTPRQTDDLLAPSLEFIGAVIRLLDALPVHAVLVHRTSGEARVVHANTSDEPPGRSQPPQQRIAFLPGYELLIGAARTVPAGAAQAPLTSSPPGLAERLSERGRAWHLTDRQRRALAAVVQGATNKDIAHELGVSVSMVEQHLRSIYRKAGVDQRCGLLAAFWRVSG